MTKPLFTITEEMVGQSTVKIGDRPYPYHLGFMGRVQPQDVGKRVSEVACDGGGTILQVENNQQRDARVARGDTAIIVPPVAVAVTLDPALIAEEVVQATGKADRETTESVAQWIRQNHETIEQMARAAIVEHLAS